MAENVCPDDRGKFFNAAMKAGDQGFHLPYQTPCKRPPGNEFFFCYTFSCKCSGGKPVLM